MTKDDFNELEIIDQLKYINIKLSENKSLRAIANDLKMSKTTFRDRFLKIGYVYSTETKRYYRDINLKVQITLQKHARTIKQAIHPISKVIQNDNKSIIEMETVKKENIIPSDNQEIIKLKNALSEVKELLEMKDQLKELIQDHNRSKSIIDVIEPHELKVDKDRFEGGLKGRLIKVYDNVNNEWISFCKSNDQFKMQDLYSIALLEFIEKYKK